MPQLAQLVLSGKNLAKVYTSGGVASNILSNINLQIKSGASVAITGKSGSGKSTLMHILSGLDNKYSGEITLDNQKLSSLKITELDEIRNQKVGFIFQTFYLQTGLDVLENVALPLKIAGVGKKQRQQKALAALAKVGLTDRANYKGNQLSGGQRQRVCIARAIVHNPTIIFADEPTGNLDSATGATIEKLLFGLNKQGATLVIVTHDLDLVKKCQQIISLKDGKLL